jgi:hypothetical protein
VSARVLGFILLAGTALAATPDSPRAAYLRRAQAVAAWRAAQPDQPGFEMVSDNTRLAVVAARLRLGLEPEWCTRTVVELMRRPTGDMFWMFPCVAVSYLGRDRLGPEAHAAIREAWRTYFPLRGDTENHWVMYYASLYLMAQQWPGESGGQWFNGKSSTENQAEARSWLERWCEVTTTIGQGEYDCTHYLGEYATALVMLAAWAEDPAMRQRARMMLDYLFADFAVENLDGLYVGAHARTDEVAVLEKWACFASYFSWLLFAQGPTPSEYSQNGWGWGTYFALLADKYEVPEVIRQIATDRSQPFLHRELKRPRHRWRQTAGRPEPVCKATYMTRDYAVGSDQGGLHQPLQQHSWDVTWAVPDPRGVHNTLFAVQPFCSGEALQTFYTDYPDWMPERVAQQGKPSYLLEDKLLGGSPYEQVFQQDDTIVSLTCVPDDARFGHLNGFFSKDLAVVEEDPSGWIFVQGGRAFIAYRPLAAYEWRPYARYKSVWTGEREEAGDRRLRSAARRNGTIVQAAGAGEFADFAGFKAAIRALPLSYRLEPVPVVEFTTLRGRRLVCAFGAAPLVDGVPVDHAAWKLFDGPYLHAERDSMILTLAHGRLERVLDFRTLTVTDRVKH